MLATLTRGLLLAGLGIGGAGLMMEGGTLAQTPAKAWYQNVAKSDDLEGTWEVIELTRGDLAAKVLPNEDMNGQVDFEDDTFRFTISFNGKIESSLNATFVHDPSQLPGTIDLTYLSGPDRGRVALGIYELNGDELRICVPLNDSLADRPTEMNAENGSNRMLYVLRRLER